MTNNKELVDELLVLRQPQIESKADQFKRPID